MISSLVFLIFLLILFLDLLLGDPNYRWHPVRLLGGRITKWEEALHTSGRNGKLAGVGLMVISVLFLLALAWAPFMLLIYLVAPWVGILWTLYFLYSMISFKDLLVHGKRISRSLKETGLEEARVQTAMMVSRSTAEMDEDACLRAGIESMAENFVDGLVAPLFYFFTLGLYGMVAFKAVSTLDSMIGYKSERYRNIGWASARLDDLLCWIPARLSFVVMVVAAFLTPGLKGKDALIAGLRQHGFHDSPNSGWPMATMAGALGVRLGGPVKRDGHLVEEPWYGRLDAPSQIDEKTYQKSMTLLKVSLGLLVGLVTLLYVLFPGQELGPPPVAGGVQDGEA